MPSACRLGAPVATPGFHNSTTLFPPETLSSWRDPQKSFTLFFSITATPVDCPTAAAHEGSTAATCEVPRFTITAVPGNVPPPASGTVQEALGSFSSNAVEVACSYVGPEDACGNLFSTQELAQALRECNTRVDPEAAAIAAAADACVAAKAVGELTASEATVTEGRLLQLRENHQLLATLQRLPTSMPRCPKFLFGLSEIAVLKVLEGQPQVENCVKYKYVQVRACTSTCSCIDLSCGSCMRVVAQA